jgi:hypothetical protein
MCASIMLTSNWFDPFYQRNARVGWHFAMVRLWRQERVAAASRESAIGDKSEAEWLGTLD